MSAHPETQVNALVLQAHQMGESDVLLDLLTEECRLNVVARGVRKLESRLRYSLEPFSLITATLIESRSGPRLINATFSRNIYFDLAGAVSGSQGKSTNLLNQKILVRLVNLITRVVPPDESQDWNKDFLELLESQTEKVAIHYLLVTGYILEQLGYLNFNELLDELCINLSKPFTIFELINREALPTSKQLRLKQAITTALENSQL
jgi:hypothetical protein